MPVNLQRLRIFVSQKAKVGIFFQRTGEVNEVAIGFGCQSGICQPRADGLRNVERSRPLGNILHAPIRKLYMNAVCHKSRPEVVVNPSVYWRDSGGSNAVSRRLSAGCHPQRSEGPMQSHGST